ncbi:MAG TPA: S9 family peptidase [Longimicrobiaceae bacterium]|nr:S9 family peptidase [Longimicrobiaceae bacterium]
MHRSLRRTALALAWLAAVPAALVAQPPAVGPNVFTVARYLDYETVGDPQLSPDGSQIVYTRRWIDRMEDRWESALWIMDADGSRNRFLAKGSGPQWSPDGRRVAYLAEGEPKGTQLWVRWIDAEGPATQVTRVTESPGNVRWAPDGRTLGFTMFVPKSSTWKIELPPAPEGAKWTRAPRFEERLHYRQDRRGFTDPGFVHLFTVPADGGTPRQVTTGDWNVGFRFDALAGGVGWNWTPDGRTIVVEGLNEPDHDARYRDADLFAVDVASGTARKLTPDRGTWHNPVVSPDGRRVAFTGHEFTPHTYRAEDLYVVELAGGGMRKISGALDRDPETLHWAPDGSGVYFSAEDRGSRNLYFATTAGEVRPVTRGTHLLVLSSVGRGGVGAGIRVSSHEPADVVRIDLRRGSWERLTRVNEDVLAGVRLGEVEEIWYTSTGGTRVQGWIVKPPNFDPARDYPLVLEIHGGPHAMYNVGFNPMLQNFAAHGYVVLYTNPRGSTGYGSAFGNAIDRAYPSVDYDDLMAGVDSLVARGYVDPQRMYVGGCSGGGVLTSWVIGHTDRFAAAAVRCPVINWLSFAGQTDVPLFTGNFFEKPFWEDPAPWLRQSPLMYVGNVKTPTLLMTGELDLRTPMPQTEEYYAALKVRGVPTALLRFEGEYHGTGSRPSNWMRTQLYMMSWYERWPRREAAPQRAATDGN